MVQFWIGTLQIVCQVLRNTIYYFKALAILIENTCEERGFYNLKMSTF